MAALRGRPVALTQVSEVDYAEMHPHLRPQKLVIVGDVPGGGGGGATAWEDITGKPAVIGAGATQVAARTAIGAGTSSLVIGTASGTAVDAALNTTALAGKAPTSHTHVGTAVTLTGYAIGTVALAPVAAADTVNAAIAKLEKRIADLEAVTP